MTINGRGGSDALLGRDGFDSMDGGNDDDTLDGGNGSDTMIGGAGDDVMAGGGGNDRFVVGLGNDTHLGGIGNDFFFAGSGSDSHDGGSGEDGIDYAAADSVELHLGAQRANFAGGIDTLVSVENATGSSGNDLLIGSSADNELAGSAGDDFLSGLVGFDDLRGGDGHDTLFGGLGSDDFFGDAGFDLALLTDRRQEDSSITLEVRELDPRSGFAEVRMFVASGGEADAFVGIEALEFTGGGYRPAGTLEVSNGFLKEGAAGSQQMEFVLHLTAVLDHSAVVGVRTSNGTATAGSDYTALDTQVTIPAFAQDVSIFVPVSGDALVEQTETFFLEVTDVTGDLIAGGFPSITRTGFILADEGDVSPDDDYANSIASGAVLPLGAKVFGSIETGSDRDFIRVDLIAGQAYHFGLEGAPTFRGTNPDVYLTLRDAAGEFVAEDDDGGQGRNSFLAFTPESTGAYFVDVSGFGQSNPGTYELRLDLASSLPEVHVENLTVVEGDAGRLFVNVGVRSSRIYDTDITVLATPVSGTAQAGTDFEAIPLLVTIFAGSNRGATEIEIIADHVLEEDETFSVVLSNPTNAVLAAQSSGTVEILNDDDVALVTILNGAVGEGNAGSGTAPFTVALTGQPQAAPIVISYTVFSGSAIAGTDFTNVAAGTVTMPAGETLAVLPVFPLGDTVFEGDQVFYAALSGASGTTTVDIGTPAVARATIQDDDPVPTVAVDGIASVGGGGIDVIEGGALRDSLVGADGYDVLLAGQEADRLEGGGGDDFLIGDLVLADLGATTGGADAILGGTGKDTVLAGAGNDTVTGDSDADLLVGQAGRDLLVGGDGPDALYGGDQADSLKGGNGDDFLFGESAPDTMDGGSGNDRLHIDIDDFLADGNEGGFDAVVITGPGNWVIDLGSAVNQNLSGFGPRLMGFEVVDAATAGGTVNVTGASSGGVGNVLYGSVFNDTITGSSVTDIVLGGDGGDVINGGGGNDSIGSELGNDTLSGGIGLDAFIYFNPAGAGDVVITDFEPLVDNLWLPAGAAATAAAALALGAQVGSDTVFTFAGTGGSITLAGIALEQLTTADFRIF